MIDCLQEDEYLKSRGLIFGGRYLPYNIDLKGRAKEMRKNMTIYERKIWVDFLQKYNKRGDNKIQVLRQKIIDNYIVDFYIPKYNLVIEIDGDIHNNRKEYDLERANILNGYGLKELRFSNNEIINNFYNVCKEISEVFTNS